MQVSFVSRPLEISWSTSWTFLNEVIKMGISSSWCGRNFRKLHFCQLRFLHHFQICLKEDNRKSKKLFEAILNTCNALFLQVKPEESNQLNKIRNCSVNFFRLYSYCPEQILICLQDVRGEYGMLFYASLRTYGSSVQEKWVSVQIWQTNSKIVQWGSTDGLLPWTNSGLTSGSLQWISWL